jgi:probable DNA metabolism protein
MQSVILPSHTDFDAWKAEARRLRLAHVEPAHVRFVVGGGGQGGLFDSAPPVASEPSGAFSVPRAFVELASKVILHRDLDRFDLMYRLLWRLRDEPDILRVASDPDVATAHEKARNVSRASHKMKAFVRFRETEDDKGPHWVAWFEPAHRVVEMTAPFFARRFTTMRWSILTPDGTAHWDGDNQMSFGPPARQEDAPGEDAVEDFWKTYYASTFNPARLHTQMMQSEMPKQYWKNLPEAELIPSLVASATGRMEAMVSASSPGPNLRFERSKAPVLDRAATDAQRLESLDDLGAALKGCRRCPLWRDATEGVCGVGARAADVMVVGEQPGDHEDLMGQPFVGPAGQVLDKALKAAGLNRPDLYLTNAVKHFKHAPTGKRRLHKTPNAGEVQACRWWLDQEVRLVKPRLIVALGATAGLALLGRKPAMQSERGQVERLADKTPVLLTYHPSYLLRMPDAETRKKDEANFVSDLARILALSAG